MGSILGLVIYPWVGNFPLRRAWQPTSVFLPGESHGRRSLVSYGPYHCKKSDTTEETQFFLISLTLFNFSRALFGTLTRKLALYLLHSTTHCPCLPLFLGAGIVKQWEDRRKSRGVFPHSLITTRPSKRNVSFPSSFRPQSVTLLLLSLLPLDFFGAMT